ncbi:type VI secretion system baseplate subunit TssK [Escherichia coli]
MPPRQIPFQSGYIYYDIRRDGALWEHIARYGGMAVNILLESFQGWSWKSCGEFAINYE